MNKLLETALKFRSRSVSVIPVGKNKVPLIEWKEYQDRIASEAEIKEWFNRFNDAQLGIVTGKISGLTVVDVEQGGDWSKLPDTAIIKTGGDGRHFYYRYHPDFKNKVRIAPLTDIRNDGGYVIAPPSISDKGSYIILRQRELTTFPHWLFTPARGQIKPNTANRGLPEFNGTGQGSRNQDLTSYLGKLLNIIHPADWQTLAWPELIKANQKNNPPLSEFELRSIYTSISNAEKRNPPKKHYKLSAVVEDDDIDIITIDEASVTKGKLTIPYPIGYDIFDQAMKGGVRDGDLIVITGISGMGKTTFVQNVTVNLAQKALFPLWFSYEVLIDNLYAKFKDIYADELPIYVPRKITSGSVDWITKKISLAIDKMGIKFVFIDHIDFLQPKVSTGLDQRRIMLRDICQELKTLAIEKKIIIFLIAHTKKVQGREVEMQDVAESSGIYQLCDYLISVNRRTQKINQNGITIETMSDTSIAKILKNRLTGECPFFIFKVKNNKIIPTFADDDIVAYYQE